MGDFNLNIFVQTWLCRNVLKTFSALFVLFIYISLAFGVTSSEGNRQQQKTVRRIRFYGNRYFGREAVLKAMGIQEGKVLPSGWPEKAAERLLSWYHRQGYFLTQVDSVQTQYLSDSSLVDLTFWLHEGEQVRVGRVEIIGVKGIFRQEFFRLLETRPGRTFDEGVLEQDVEEILTFLENRGRPLSRVEIHSLLLRWEKDSPKMDVVLHVEKGPLVTLGAIRVEGNHLTKKEVIQREVRLKQGSFYRHREVLSAQENLQRLGYFREVSKPEVLFVKDRAIVKLKVKEGNSNTIDGIIGYNPPKIEGRRGYFTGRLHFTFRNLLGTGRFLEAYWEKKDELSQAMRLGYEEPWLVGMPLHVGGRFWQEIRDTTYVERNWRFSVRYEPWPQFSLSAEGGQKEVLPDSLGSSMFRLAQTRSWLLSIGIDYNTLDDPVNPRKGARYHTMFTMGSKRNLGPDFLLSEEKLGPKVDTRSVQVDAETVFPLFGQQVLYFGLHGTEVKTGDLFVPLSDQIRFGGASTLRGYTEDVFRGTLVAWINGEYRYLLGRGSRVFVFVDGGMYQRREKRLGMVKGAKIGYGLGIRLETRLGLMGIDYGLGEGDSLLKGKVHVGLVNRF